MSGPTGRVLPIMTLWYLIISFQIQVTACIHCKLYTSQFFLAVMLTQCVISMPLTLALQSCNLERQRSTRVQTGGKQSTTPSWKHWQPSFATQQEAGTLYHPERPVLLPNRISTEGLYCQSRWSADKSCWQSGLIIQGNREEGKRGRKTLSVSHLSRNRWRPWMAAGWRCRQWLGSELYRKL